MRAPAVLLALTAAFLLSACKESPSDKVFGAKVRAYLLAHPEVLRETAMALDKQDADQAAQKSLAAIKANRRALENDPRDFVAHPNGKITVVQFFDYNCGYCKSIAPDFLTLIDENPDVRFVFKELPIVGGPMSERAARMALTVSADKGDYLGLYRTLIETPRVDNAAIDRVLVQRGLDPMALETRAAALKVDAHIEDVKALAQELGLQGTPAFIIGDSFVGGAHIGEIKAAIAKAKAKAKA
ncbi:DsbA family protein [soil metagenome]